MSNQFLDAAIEYASKGMAVFPLKVRGKEPMTAHGVKNATTNFNTIEQWWTKYPIKPFFILMPPKIYIKKF